VQKQFFVGRWILPHCRFRGISGVHGTPHRDKA